MKKSIVAAAVVFGLGVVGMTVSLPMTAQDAVGLYNEAVIGYSDDNYKEYKASAVTDVKVKHENDWGISVEVRQSKDDDVHFYIYDSPFEERSCEIKTADGKAEITVSQPVKKPLAFNKETIIDVVRSQTVYYGTCILELPSTVTITNMSKDRVHFYLNGAEFVNSDVINQYGYVPTEKEIDNRRNENWLYKYQRAEEENEELRERISELEKELEELNNNLAQSETYGEEQTGELVIAEAVDDTENNIPSVSSDILNLEHQLAGIKDSFLNWEINKIEYEEQLTQLTAQIKSLRIQQLEKAGRDDLVMMAEDVYTLIEEYNRVEIEISDTERSYEKGIINQEQYNGIIEILNSSRIRCEKEIIDAKAEMAHLGYYWEGAMVL